MKIKDPYSMQIGKRYYITEPIYDEGTTPDTDLIEVTHKNKHNVIFKNIKHNFSYTRTYNHLLDCNIETCD